MTMNLDILIRVKNLVLDLPLNLNIGTLNENNVTFLEISKKTFLLPGENMFDNINIETSIAAAKTLGTLQNPELTSLFAGYLIVFTGLVTVWGGAHFSVFDYINIFPNHYGETLVLYNKINMELYRTTCQFIITDFFESKFRIDPFFSNYKWKCSFYKIVPNFLPMISVEDYVYNLYIAIKTHKNDPVYIALLLKETTDPIRSLVIKIISEFFSDIESNLEKKKAILNALVDLLNHLNPHRGSFLYPWVLPWIDAELIIRDPGIDPEYAYAYAYHNYLRIIKNTEYFYIHMLDFLYRDDSPYRIREQLKDPYELKRLYNFIYFGTLKKELLVDIPKDHTFYILRFPK